MAEEKKEWLCAKCKASNDPEFTHCRLCGELNPDAPEVQGTCVSCGNIHSETCCPLCGSAEFLQL